MKNMKKKSTDHFYKIIVIIGICIIIWASFSWSAQNNIFTIDQVIVNSNTSHMDGNYIAYAEALKNLEMWNINLDSVAINIEQEPFVKAVRISRKFPSTIRIDINEREPIAIINHNPIVCIDRDAVLLPSIENIFSLPVPILTNFISDEKSIALGEKTSSETLESAIDILSLMLHRYPVLYSNLSELRLTNENEFELILQDEPTRIYLGKQNIQNKLAILKEFEEVIQGSKQLTDYLYLDLRYVNQVITRERKA